MIYNCSWKIAVLALNNNHSLQIPLKGIILLKLKVTLVNANFAQTVLYFYLLMLYKVSPCRIFWLQKMSKVLLHLYILKINLCFFFYQITSQVHYITYQECTWHAKFELFLSKFISVFQYFRGPRVAEWVR
jgi:hypothetical protein